MPSPSPVIASALCDRKNLHSLINLSIYYQNTRGLRSKTVDVLNASAVCEADIVVFTETWLNDSICNGELFISKYLTFRSDRDFARTGTARGGGVLTAVDNKYTATEVKIPSLRSSVSYLIDILVVRIAFGGAELYIISLYIPPNTPYQDYDAVLDLLSSLPYVLDGSAIVLGDFNIPQYTLHIDENFTNRQIFSFNAFLSITKYSQHNFNRNRNNRILDLILCRRACIVGIADETFVPEDLHHPALHIEVSLGLSKNNGKIKCSANASCLSYNFRRADYPQLYSALLNTDWGYLDSCTDVSDSCNYFYNELYSVLDRFVPKSNGTKMTSYPAWFNGSIIRNLRSKSAYWRRYKKHGDLNAYAEFSRLRTYIKKETDDAYKSYISRIESSIKHDPAKLWSYVRETKGSGGFPSEMSYDNEKLDSFQDISDAFACYFSQSFCSQSSVSDKSTSSHKGQGSNIDILEISEDSVKKALSRAKNKFTAGPDLIPAFLLRDCASVFTSPLTKLFNLCLKTCSFPHIWKYTKVCPVYKKGEKSNIKNYRPISIFSNFAKTFEMIIYDTIYTDIKQYISCFQHGFVRDRSTVTNLMSITQSIAENIDNGAQVDVLYMDLSKAFDRIDHNLLLSKLENVGFSKHLLIFLKSYLSGRYQFVQVNGVRSANFLSTSGVPQGSILGPLLFVVFINDVVDTLGVDCLLYADDLKIFLPVTSLQDCHRLQEELDRVYDWCTENKLAINISKCQVMSYTTKQHFINFDYSLDNTVLSRPTTLHDLGVIFDAKLSFVPHIEHVVNEACRLYGYIVRSCRDFSNIDTLRLLYCTYIRSKLEYSSAVWYPGYLTHRELLESVQRRFLKFLSFKADGVYPPVGFPNNKLLQRFALSSLNDRHDCSLQVFLYKLINNEIDSPTLLAKLNFLVPRSGSRHSNTFYLPTPHTNVLKFSPVYTMCETYNMINSKYDLFSCTAKEIKRAFS